MDLSITHCSVASSYPAKVRFVSLHPNLIISLACALLGCKVVNVFLLVDDEGMRETPSSNPTAYHFAPDILSESEAIASLSSIKVTFIQPTSAKDTILWSPYTNLVVHCSSVVSLSRGELADVITRVLVLELREVFTVPWQAESFTPA